MSVKPLFFVIDGQDSIINPQYPHGPGLPHLVEKAFAIQEHIDDIRRKDNADIGWVFHTYAPHAPLIPATQSLAEITAHLHFPGDAVYPLFKPRDGDLFFLKNRVGLDSNPHFQADIKKHGLDVRPIAETGFYTEECLLSFSFGLSLQGIPSSILTDLTDNFEPIATDPKFLRQQASYARSFPDISWMSSAAWWDQYSTHSPDRPTFKRPYKPLEAKR